MRPNFIITTTNITCSRIDNGKDKAEAKFGQVAHTNQYLVVVMKMIMKMIMRVRVVVMALRLFTNNY